MNCTYTNLIGVPEECGSNLGGVKKVLLYSNKVNNAEQLVDTFTSYFRLFDGTQYVDFKQAYMPAALSTDTKEHADTFFGGGAYIYEYIPQPNSSSVVTSQNIDQATGVNFAESVITLNFNKENVNKYTAFSYLTSLTEDSHVRGFYLDNNDTWYSIGSFEYLESYTGSEINTGTNISDGQTITIMLKDNGPYAPIPVTSYLEASLNTYF